MLLKYFRKSLYFSKLKCFLWLDQLYQIMRFQKFGKYKPVQHFSKNMIYELAILNS